MGNWTQPNPPGNDCIACFTAGETPSKIAVVFADIVLCFGGPPEPNGEFILEQNPGVPCEWRLIDGLTSIYWILNDAGTSHLQQWWGGAKVFTATVGAPCSLNFANELVCAVDFEDGELGTGQIHTDLAGESYVVAEVMDLINMPKSENTNYEVYPVDAEQDVVLLARKEDGTRISILIDKEDF